MSRNDHNLFSDTLKVMGRSLGLRLSRHTMTTTNLANMDTPGYKTRDLSFEKAMQRALGPPEGKLAVAQTDAGHMPVKDLDGVFRRAENSVKYHIYGQDEKGYDVVDIDQEMTKLAQNNLLYNATVQMVAKAYEGLKYAISEGGR